MNEENVKIARIKKSCRAGKIVSTVICIASVFTLIIGIIGSIKVFSMLIFDEIPLRQVLLVTLRSVLK